MTNKYHLPFHVARTDDDDFVLYNKQEELIAIVPAGEEMAFWMCQILNLQIYYPHGHLVNGSGFGSDIPPLYQDEQENFAQLEAYFKKWVDDDDEAGEQEQAETLAILMQAERVQL